METVDLAEFVANKRHKPNGTRSDVQEFHPGAILRIRLQDFMSYSLSEFMMSPNLNMIIGPNGTGKSTIVCAICMGLAGKTEYLGKPTMQFSQFVKQGRPKAVIEIELKTTEALGRVVIKREISADDSKSLWFIDDKPATEKKVRDLVHSMDIQLDNLCQFLAQDRVSKFAAQKPSELLKEIERSFANGDLLVQHEQLVAIQETQSTTEKEKAELESRLSGLKKEKDSLQAEVEKLKKYKEKKQDLQMHKHLIPFVQIQDAKEKFNRAKAERDSKIASLKDFEQQVKPISNLIKNFTVSSNTLSDEIEKLDHDLVALKRKIEKYTKASADCDSQIESLEEDLRAQLTEILKKSRKLELLETESKEMEERRLRLRDSVVDVGHLKAKIAERSSLSQDLNSRRHEVNAHKERVRLLNDRERKYDKVISDLTQQLNTSDKLNVLSASDNFSQLAKTAKAIQFLRQNKEAFEGKAFESPVVSLSVARGYGTIMGNVVSLDSQLAIVTASESSHHTVTKAIMDQLKLNVSFRQISSNFSIDYSTRLSQQRLKELGFDGYLNDFVTGPAPVIQMLCEQHNIHLVPVALRSLSAEQLSAVERESSIQTFVSGDQILRRFTSLYGNKRSYSTATFLNANYALFDEKGLSHEAKQKILERIEMEKESREQIINEINQEKSQYDSQTGEYTKLQEDYGILDREIKEAHESRKRYEKVVRKCEQLSEDIEVLKDEINKLGSQNHSDIKEMTNKEILRKVEKKFQAIQILQELYEEMNKIKKEIVFKKFDQIQQDNRKASIQDVSQDVEARRRALEDECERAKAYCKELRHKTSAEIKALNAKVATDLTNEERDVLAALTKRYMELGEFEESKIMMKIEQIRRELNSFGDAEESSIGKLSRVETSIQDIEGRLPDLESACTLFKKQIQDLEREWEPRLEELVNSISTNFNENFGKIYPAGEVRLSKDPEKYQNWKLEIAVQFRREEPMSILDGSTQSGGEKSVTTAIFLNSLQGLTNSPFRVVDEINQGMDARNERLVHALIVEGACSEGNSSQYFLITPKLLTDLKYHSNMSVHCIMAGKFCPDPLIDDQFLKFGIAANYVS